MKAVVNLRGITEEPFDIVSTLIKACAFKQRSINVTQDDKGLEFTSTFDLCGLQ